MSRLKMLLRVSVASPRNTQQPLLHRCEPVAQHTQHAQQSLLHVAPPSTRNTKHAELRALVDAVAAFHCFTREQTAEAYQIAQADQVASLECFRSLAARDGLTTFRKANQIIDMVGSLHEQ